jgi:hypothetical protein
MSTRRGERTGFRDALPLDAFSGHFSGSYPEKCPENDAEAPFGTHHWRLVATPSAQILPDDHLGRENGRHRAQCPPAQRTLTERPSTGPAAVVGNVFPTRGRSGLGRGLTPAERPFPREVSLVSPAANVGSGPQGQPAYRGQLSGRLPTMEAAFQSPSAAFRASAKGRGTLQEDSGRWCSRAQATVSGSLPAAASRLAPMRS